jgi:hypothetical protein
MVMDNQMMRISLASATLAYLIPAAADQSLGKAEGGL